MSTDLLAPPRLAPAAPVTPQARNRRVLVGVGLAAGVAMAAWLPFVGVPSSPDESGFWLLAQHWAPGPSLYGGYWVDRPPVLLWLFELVASAGHAHLSGGALALPGLKLLGAVASGLSVLLAALVARIVAPRRPWTLKATVVGAVALLSDPLLGMPETDGEVLAIPFVLLGVACLVAATGRRWGLAAAALTVASGVAAAGAALVKQNVVDVFVFALLLLMTSGHPLGSRLRWAASFAGGVAATLAVVLPTAAARGTTPDRLWDAIVVFRVQAAVVIRASASDATSARMSNLLLASLVSGCAVLLVVAAAALVGQDRRRRQRADRVPTVAGADRGLVWSALGMVAWETAGVVLGGSYWLHYLTGLVPGIVVLLALVRPTPRWRMVLTGCLAYALLAGAVVWVQHATTPVPVSDDDRVVTYLRGHAAPSDGVVVAFGHPDIVAASGLESPYPYLWSLPVRVRDPRLRQLGTVMTGSGAPRWVVVAGESLASWGLDADAAQRILEAHYVEQVSFGDWHVWQHRDGGTGSR